MGRSDKLWKYLQDSGVLEHGTKEDIEKAKKEYRKLYEREFRSRRRTEMHEHTVSFNEEEFLTISIEAARHGLSIPGMVHDASLAYCNERTVLMEPALLRKIEALLVRTLSAIVRIGEKEKGWFARTDKMEEIRRVILNLREEFRKEIHSPKLLEEGIRRNPKRVLEILNRLDNDRKSNRD